jgi:hypothetical protein
MNRLVAIAIVLIAVALVVFASVYKLMVKPRILPTTAAVEGAAIDAVDQELQQAIANITEQDIENALTQMSQ